MQKLTLLELSELLKEKQELLTSLNYLHAKSKPKISKKPKIVRKSGKNVKKNQSCKTFYEAPKILI